MTGVVIFAPSGPTDHEKEAFVACATAVALHSGGMTLCGGAIMRLDDAMRAMGGRTRSLLGPLGEALLAGRWIVDAQLQANDVLFDASRHLLRCALASYWAGRAAALGV